MDEVERLLDLLEDMELETVLEWCGLSPEEALEILYMAGHLELPPFLESSFNDDEF